MCMISAQNNLYDTEAFMPRWHVLLPCVHIPFLYILYGYYIASSHQVVYYDVIFFPLPVLLQILLTV